MRDSKDRDGSSAGKSSATMVSCVCATVPSALMASLYGKFILLDLTANGSARDVVRPSHEVEMANEALRQRVAELEARNGELEVFARTVAHDLKGPICSLAGCADFMVHAHTSLSDGELQKGLGVIHRSALQLGHIVDELLLLCGLSHEKAETTELDMTSIVDRALHRLAYRIEDKGVKVALPETWPVAVGHGPWIEEVWVNYIDNAIKYGGRPAYVELGAERANGCAVSRTERIANRAGRSSGQETPRRTTNLDPKGRGNKSMSVKRRTVEDVYAVALQRLSDMAKATLPEPQCPAAEPRALR
jgi:hypothetical protein